MHYRLQDFSSNRRAPHTEGRILCTVGNREIYRTCNVSFNKLSVAVLFSHLPIQKILLLLPLFHS
jgi:hypothetical protein